MKWLDGLFTVSKHVGPTVAAAAQPALDVAKASVADATSSIDPLIDELTAGIAGLMSAYASKIGAVGDTLAPIAIVRLQLGTAAAKHAVDSHIEATQPATGSRRPSPSSATCRPLAFELAGGLVARAGFRARAA